MDDATRQAVERGKTTYNRIAELRGAMFLPIRTMLGEFGKVATEACVAGVIQSILSGREVGEGALLDVIARQERQDPTQGTAS